MRALFRRSFGLKKAHKIGFEGFVVKENPSWYRRPEIRGKPTDFSALMPDETSGPDKRTDPRHAMILRVDYRDREGFLRDATENVSAGGIFVRTDRAFQIGDPARVALSFPGLLSAVELAGTVTWIRPSTPGTPGGVGIRVDGEEDRRRLAELARAAGAPPPAPAAPAPGATAAAGPKRYRVLLVEDNPHVIEMYAYALKRMGKLAGEAGAGVDVVFAANGHEAIAALKQGGVELVVTDLYMPVMDGFQLVERVREDPATKAIPVLVVSAGGKDAKLRAEQSGADAFLQKPVRFVDVLETIRNLLKLKS